MNFLRNLLPKNINGLPFSFFWSRDARTFVTMEIVSSDPTVYLYTVVQAELRIHSINTCAFMIRVRLGDGYYIRCDLNS